MPNKKRLLRNPDRLPNHPGVIYRDISIPSLRKSKGDIAKDLGISRNRLYELIEGKASFTTEMALRFAKYFGGSARVILSMQNDYDIWHQSKELDLSEVPEYKGGQLSA